MTDIRFDQAYPVAQRAAAFHSALAAQRYGLRAQAAEDFEQELMLELWRKFPQFDEGRSSWPTFAERIAANRIISLVRTLRSQRSGYGKNQPLVDLDRSLTAPKDDFDLRIEVQRVLAGLGDFDHAVARHLINHSAIETGRRLGVSRATIYRSIERLRAAFKAAGLCSTVFAR
jgi:RNA polymerase sigma factor (sigma-70 family)